MNIEDQIHVRISTAKEISPFEIVKIIQELTAFPIDRAVKGYFHYKNKYLDQLQLVEEHESVLNSPNFTHLALLDVKIGKHTTERIKSLKRFKISCFYFNLNSLNILEAKEINDMWKNHV